MKEQFALAASKEVLKHLDTAADQAGLSRGQAEEDLLRWNQSWLLRRIR